MEAWPENTPESECVRCGSSHRGRSQKEAVLTAVQNHKGGRRTDKERNKFPV